MFLARAMAFATRLRRLALTGVAATAIGTTIAPAQAQMGGPDQEQMMRVGTCMANIDPAAMEAMQSKGEAFQNDLKRLCKAGQRDAALQRARQFGLEMASDSLMKQIKACTAGLTMPYPADPMPAEKLNATDICAP